MRNNEDRKDKNEQQMSWMISNLFEFWKLTF